MHAEQTGTRRDLAAFLWQNRKPLKLTLFDVWGSPELPTHTFYSRLDDSPFGGRSRFLDYTIYPF